MDLKSQNLLWPKQDGTPYNYPTLRQNTKCDVAIIGGGIIGSLLAYYLSSKKQSVVLLDKRDIGKGSTSASTALLMYQLDENFSALIKKIGYKNAVRAYKISRSSVFKIKQLIKKLKVDCKFREKKVLYLASTPGDVAILKQEYKLFKKYHFKVHFLEHADLKTNFGINKQAALILDEAAEADPYVLTHELVHQAHLRGVKIYSKTEVVSYNDSRQEKLLRTHSGKTITAKHIIFSTGYESVQYLKEKIVSLKSSYVIASQPQKKLKSHWLKDYLVWETARPYLYIRTTNQNRLLVGGADEKYISPTKRDKKIPAKSRVLKQQFNKLVPDLKFSTQYSWTGTFGETKDGLGYIGVPTGFKNIYFALGFGGNGITFGIIAAEILSQLVLGKKCKDKILFSFER